MIVEFNLISTIKRDSSNGPIELTIELFESDTPANIIDTKKITYDFTVNNQFGLQAVSFVRKFTVTPINVSIRLKTNVNSLIALDFSSSVGYVKGAQITTSSGYNEIELLNSEVANTDEGSLNESIENFSEIQIMLRDSAAPIKYHFLGGIATSSIVLGDKIRAVDGDNVNINFPTLQKIENEGSNSFYITSVLGKFRKNQNNAKITKKLDNSPDIKE
jgi:hypothetical protein